MSRKIEAAKIFLILLITAMLMATAATSIYAAYAKPAFYTKFMTLGNKYLNEGKYKEAILEFTKAVKIDGKSTKARIGIAKGSIELGDVDTAVRVLKEAQKIDFDNTELLCEIIDILKDADPDAAYEILMNYVKKHGKGNLDSDVRKLLDSANEKPKIPEIIPQSGTYIKPFSMRLKSDKVRVGHTFYYTDRDKEPDKKDKQYRGGIQIQQDAHIKIRGYNPKGEHTDVFEAEYVIDSSIETQIKNIIAEAKEEMKKTEVGKEVGNCIEGAKEKLQSKLDKGENLLEKNYVSAEAGNEMYAQLSEAFEQFHNSIIVPTEREALKKVIVQAERTEENAVEGSDVGQYREGAKETLESDISNAKKVYKNLIARQEHIDLAKDELTNALADMEAKKVTQTDKIIEETGAKIGPVTVSLLWNTTDDLDLHVTSPLGDTIYFNNKNGSSGGRLDVDRQVSDFVTNPVENIFWQTPPRGTYTVKVNMYSKRTEGSVPFKVRLIVDGRATIYDMNITNGTSNVCTFSY